MTLSNIEPLARKIAERICRQHSLVNPSDPPMTEVDCQIACNRDPLFASNRDPSEALGFGLSM